MRTSLVTAMGITPAYALKLLVSSYGPSWNESGAVQILNHKADSTTLSIAHTNQDCGTMTTWLDMSLGEGRVTCIDEAIPGSINLLAVKPNDSITRLSTIKTVGGPVSSAFFNENGTVALAHYTPPAVTTFGVRANNNTFAPLQSFNMTFPTGPNKNRQDTAHIHQAITDPTGKFIICPNLGSDLVHVFAIDPATDSLTPETPLTAKPGYGPRHAHFWQPTSNCKDTFLLVVNELSNRLTSFKVTYLEAGGLSFEEVDDVSTYGDRMPLAEATAAEIAASPDNKFIVVSNRNAPVSAPNPDPNNSTAIMSDSIATFKPTDSGKLEFVELAMSGGVAPRHFSLNKDGSMIAVANGATQNVIVFSRDIETGKLGKVVAYAPKVGTGQLTNVQWLEN